MAASGVLFGLGLLAGVAVGPLAVFVMAPLLYVVQFLRGGVHAASLMLVMACVLFGGLRGAAISQASPIISLEESTTALGVVESLPVAGGEYERAIVRVLQLQTGEEKWSAASGRVLAYFPENGPGVSKGDQVLLVWDASPLNHLAPGYARFVRAQGASGSGFVWTYSVEREGPAWMESLSIMRRRVAASVAGAVGGDAGALASGIITGDDSGLSDSAADAFRRTGTTHITAVSGQNIALLVAFLALWMRPGRRSTRLWTHAAMILTVWMYAAMVGLEPPALRAAIVASLTLLGTWFGRRPDPLTILALTLGGMAFIHPRMVDNTGFWLSAAASWALCSAMTTEQDPGIRAAITNTVKGVVAANIATLPIIMWTFGEWSPISPVANLLLGPVMTITFPATYALAFLGLAAPALVRWFAWIPGVGLDLALAIIGRLAPLMPLVQLPVDGDVMAIVIALPCFAALALMSRDGARWRQIATRRWCTERKHRFVIVSGVVIGGAMAVLARTLAL